MRRNLFLANALGERELLIYTAFHLSKAKKGQSQMEPSPVKTLSGKETPILSFLNQQRNTSPSTIISREVARR